MDIACPSCGATYRVPDALAASGKALRCAACGHSWVPGADPAAARAAEAPRAGNGAAGNGAAASGAGSSPGTAPALAAPAVPPRGRPSGSPPPGAARRPRGQALLPMAWAASLLAAGGLLGGLLAFRAEIAAAWPPFGHVVLLLGG